MTNTKLTGAVMALTLMLLASCGGDDDQADADDTTTTAAAEAETVDVTVLLTDAPPLEVLFNHDDVTCTTVDITAAMDLVGANPDASTDELFEMLPPVEITLRDAGGSIVGTESIKGAGGTFGSGCEWPVEFDQVPVSDFYEVTVQAGDIERTATGEGGGDTVIELDL